MDLWPLLRGVVSLRRSLRVVIVERGSSVGRMPDSQSREPGFEPRCYRFEVWAFSFTSRRLSRLSCINEYLAIDSGGHVSE